MINDWKHVLQLDKTKINWFVQIGTHDAGYIMERHNNTSNSRDCQA
jgi:hypothetical protein